jgi:Flp pilus assembly protein CpaB
MSLPAATAADAFRQPGELLGRVLSSGLEPGELIQTTALVPEGQQPGLRPVSVNVEPVGLGQLRPGTPVDVLLSQGAGPATVVSVVVRGAVVLGVSSPAGGLAASSSSAQATLGVRTLSEVEAVVQAAHSGTVTLVVAEPSDGIGLGPGSSAGGK